MPRSRRSWTDVGLAAAALVVGVAAESRSYSWSDTRHWLPDLITGWTLIGCGVIARGRAGLLLAAAGLSWYAGNFSSAALVVHRGPLTHLVLTFPDGASGVLPAVFVAYVASAVGGAWLTEPSTIVVAVALFAGGVSRSLRSVGRRRREARFALRAATAVAGVLGVVATVNLTSENASAHDTALLAYEAALCGVAVYLTHGVLRRPWERPQVTDLVVDLSETRTATVRDALAHALGDPTLDVAYKLDADYVDAEGRMKTLPSGDSRRLTRIERDGEEVAVLVHDPAVLEDAALIAAVAAATRLAAANARLQADVRTQLSELEASRRRLVEAADAERRRLERRLRAGAALRLTAIERHLAAARAVADGASQPAITQAEEQLAKTARELYQLAAGLHPHELGERGLAAAIAELAAGSPVPVETLVETGRLPNRLEVTAYFVCSEALANVAKHAEASRARVSIEERGDAVVVEIEDDGRGGADPRSIADRVEAMGGTLAVDSPPGGGTRLRAELPR